LFSTPELYRKLIHLASSIIPLSYLYLFPDRALMAVLLSIVVVLSFILDHDDIQKINWIKNIFTKYLNPLMRKSEINGRLTGATWLFISSFITVLIFPMDIAVYALLIMTVSDAVAALVGLYFGKRKIFNKTFEGTLAGIIVGISLCFLVPTIPFMIAVIGVITGMSVELLPLRMNDNLSIPLVSGGIMHIARTYLV